ncbi:hypothetical protein [Anaerovorax sp. IOR16]|uniref:hypothetical protein n=1 Tax=Anaerovorax sp. IOR16 TaxID=2773458 RepID=UPI0019CFACCC|nr:hypothetical protein [Anaerovorax sp. IOR16]
MGQPIIQTIIPFDATKPYSIKFIYVGNQVVKHTITIKDNITNATVYNSTNITFQLEHTIPENTLVNGKFYNVSVIVYDNVDVASTPSVAAVFNCLSTPIFGFSNISPNQIIKNSSIEVQLLYSQLENEQLNSWQVILYDYAQNILYKTDISYDISTLKTTIEGLLNNSQYFFQAIGETVNKISISTNLIPVSVSYQEPSISGLLSLKNIREQGRVEIGMNVRPITGKASMDYPIFIDNSKIDLTPFKLSWLLTDDGIPRDYVHYVWDDNAIYNDTKKWTETNRKYYDENGNFLGSLSPSITYNEGFKIDDNAVICFKGSNFQYFTEVAEADTEKYHLSIKYLKGIFEGSDIEKAYFQLDIANSVVSYTTITNYIDIPNTTDILLLYLKIDNNICDFKVKNITTGGA